jgi:Cu-processing system permease protein
MLARIVAVAINTFREAVRDRVLYGVLGVALGVLIFTLALGALSLDQQQRIVLDVGLASISLFSVIVAVFLGSSLLYKEIERKTLYVILPKPIHRHEFLLGKYFGICLTAFVFICIMGCVQMFVAALQSGFDPLGVLGAMLGCCAVLGIALWRATDRTAVLVPWSLFALGIGAWVASQTHMPLVPVLAALALSVGEVMMLAAVAVLFSSFSTPFLTALLTTGVWVVGRSADTMAAMKTKVVPLWVIDALKQLVEVWPNFNLFVPGRHTLEVSLGQHAGPLTYVGTTLTYAVLYSAVLLTLASLLFKRRDFL